MRAMLHAVEKIHMSWLPPLLRLGSRPGSERLPAESTQPRKALRGGGPGQAGRQPRLSSCPQLSSCQSAGSWVAPELRWLGRMRRAHSGPRPSSDDGSSGSSPRACARRLPRPSLLAHVAAQLIRQGKGSRLWGGATAGSWGAGHESLQQATRAAACWGSASPPGSAE